MHIAMVSSECEPFAKTGGLADVVDALSRALGAQGDELDVYLPRYRDVAVPDGAVRDVLTVPAPDRGDGAAGDATVEVALLSAPAAGYRIRLVDHPESFDRAGFYGEGGADYPDNGRRFTLFAQAVFAAIRAEGRPVDVIHGHDWQAGPALLLLRDVERRDPLFRHTGSLLTCHNLAYHGWVARERAGLLGRLPGVGVAEGIDLLREAIGAADLVNTVSPTYAQESRTPEHGMGLDDLLSDLGDRYSGILNGIDLELWNPETDRALPARYGVADLSGKNVCRADLCERHGLDPDGPVLGMISRLDPQKGFDLVAEAAPQLLDDGARIVVLGAGDSRLVEMLQQRAAERPERIVVLDRFDREEARRIYAGADLFLMPSRFEPCGQGQMIALRYGTMPVVRQTGGLADTVMDADSDPDRGNGFTFVEPSPEAFAAATRRAMEAWRDPPRWARLMERAMSRPFSWDLAAETYRATYRRTIRAHPDDDRQPPSGVSPVSRESFPRN